VPFLPLAQEIAFTQDEKSYSVFGSLDWHITEQFKLSPGVRGTRVTKDFAGALFYGTASQPYGGVVTLPTNLTPLAAALGLGTPYNRTLSRTDDAWMPSLSAQYQFDRNVMTYASYTRGFKSGGFNASDTTGVAANQPFDSESVDAYELGIKSKLWNNRLLLNLDVFRSDFEDLQVAALRANAANTFTSVVQNAAKSRSQGLELESVWVVSESVRLALQGMYLDAYYVSYPNASPSAIQQLAGAKVQDLSGRPTQFAPRTSGSATVTFSPTIGSYQLTAEARELWSASYYLSGVDDELLKQGQYIRWDARLSLEKIGSGWGLDLIGKNLTDRNILEFAGSMATSLGSSLQQKQMPRNYAIQGRYRW
jgi:outer membrane receptor protein involved in Fe transport